MNMQRGKEVLLGDQGANSVPQCKSTRNSRLPFCFFFLIHFNIHWIFSRELLSLVFFFNNFMFLAVLSLRCCSGYFSCVGSKGLLCSCGDWASRCHGFSRSGAWALGAQASVDVTRGLSSCGSCVLEHGLSSSDPQA